MDDNLVLWENNRDILVSMCVPLFLKRASQRIWLCLDVIKLLRDYLWDIIPPGRMTEARIFKTYGSILRKVGVTWSEPDMRDFFHDLQGLTGKSSLRELTTRESIILLGTAGIVVLPNSIPRWDLAWLIMIMVSSPIGKQLLRPLTREQATGYVTLYKS